jgi:hypothetical protein
MCCLLHGQVRAPPGGCTAPYIARVGDIVTPEEILGYAAAVAKLAKRNIACAAGVTALKLMPFPHINELRPLLL